MDPSHCCTRTTRPLAPTAVLPSLADLHTYTAARVCEALRALQDVYFPHAPSLVTMDAAPVLKQSLTATLPAWRRRKRVAHLVRHDSVPDSGYASAEDTDPDDATDSADEGEAQMAQDADERGYATQWLIGLVKRGDAWVGETAEEEDEEEEQARVACLEDASRLLARFAGNDAPEEALTRTFVFPFRMSSGRGSGSDDGLAPPIVIELNDAPVDGSDHTAVGLQSWGSAIVFAERMCLDPERYLGAWRTCARRRQVLELGAGTGLLSITAAQIFSRMDVPVRIKATDDHPDVLENLARNVQHHHLHLGAVHVTVEELDWCAEMQDGDVGAYDVVLAADVVYYPEHAGWVRGCVERALKKGGVFWLIIPVRTIGRHEGLTRTVEEAFPVANREQKRKGEERLAIVHREDVERADGVGRADEGGYLLFEIRWM